MPGRRRPGGVIEVAANLADTLYALAPDAYVPVTLTTPGGDEEVIRLEPSICGDAVHGYWDCRSGYYSVRNGESARILEERVRALNARVSLILLGDSTTAFVYFLGPERNARLATIASWAEVWRTGKNGISVIGGAGMLEPALALGMGLPYELGPVVQRDGVVQAAPGTTVMLRYVQPTGDTLRFTFVL